MTSKKMNQQEILNQFPDLAKRQDGAKPNAITELCKQFCDFADDQDFVMNPKGYEHYIKGYLKDGCCPCDDTRKTCPCPQAVEEVKDKGHCLCRLFWRSYRDFKEKMLS